MEIFVLVVGIVVTLLIYGFKHARRAQIRSWPTVTVDVDECTFDVHIPSETGRQRAQFVRLPISYILFIDYRYTLDGKEYARSEKKRIRTQTDAYTLRRTYQKGSRIKAFYNPKNPAEVYIDDAFT